MLFSMFVMFSPLWWLLVVLATAAIISAIEQKEGLRIATAVLVATLLLMTLGGDLPLLTWATTLPAAYYLAATILGYFIVGAAWGCFKWLEFNSSVKNDYEDEKRAWLERQGQFTSEVPENLKSEWSAYLKRSSKWSVDTNAGRVIQIKPRPWQHAYKILKWMSYWPWSALWFCLHDLVQKAFIRIQRRLNALLEYISSMVFRNVEKDWVETPIDSE